MVAERVLATEAELERRIDAADKEIGDLCTGRWKWRMTIPVEPTDSDIVFSDLTAAARMLLTTNRRLVEAAQAVIAAFTVTPGITTGRQAEAIEALRPEVEETR